MADLKVRQIVSDGIRNVVILEIKDNSGRIIYANVDACNNISTAVDVARTRTRGY